MTGSRSGRPDRGSTADAAGADREPSNHDGALNQGNCRRYMPACKQDKAGRPVDCGNLFGRFGHYLLSPPVLCAYRDYSVAVRKD
jgi:hypothetical protein